MAVLILLLTLAGTATGFFGWHPGSPSNADRSETAGLPAAVGTPGMWSADETKHPLGAATALISGKDWFGDGTGWYGAVIGAGSGDYRVFVNDAGAAGFGAVLSPDGRRLASGDGILDVTAGRWTAYPNAWHNRDIAPQAWSPDGTRLAVTSRTPGDDETYPGSANGAATSLSLLDVSTDVITEIGELDDNATLDGWTAAFSPDGTRLAYQEPGRVRIVTLADRKSVGLPVPAGSRLAGRGSWTRDGKGLLVVSGERCSSCGDYPVRWTVTTLAAATGAAQGPEYQINGAYAVRVLGWWASGRPVAVAYTTSGKSPVTLFDDEAGRSRLIGMDNVESARLLELAPGSEHHQLSAVGTETIEVADNVLAAGEVGPGDVPATSSDKLTGGILTVAAIAAGIALLSGGYALWRRRFRPRSAGSDS
ncbi:hypothetical protein ACWKSP_40265 [Micromonosporaceae bacterium Da 78-11]